MRRLVSFLVISTASVALAFGVPATASAGAEVSVAIEVGQIEGNLGIGSEIGMAARTTISKSGTDFVVSDPGGVTALDGCTTVTATKVTCPAEGLTSVQFTGRGNGNDVVVAKGGLGVKAYLMGGNGTDKLTSGGGSDELWGQGGADTLVGNAGADTLYGGPGNDLVKGSLGNDRAYGGPGNDVLDESAAAGGGGKDMFWGDAGNDTIRAKGDPSLAERIYGGTGNDTASRDPWDSYDSIEHVF